MIKVVLFDLIHYLSPIRHPVSLGAANIDVTILVDHTFDYVHGLFRFLLQTALLAFLPILFGFWAGSLIAAVDEQF